MNTILSVVTQSLKKKEYQNRQQSHGSVTSRVPMIEDGSATEPEAFHGEIGSVGHGPWDSTLFDQGSSAKFFVANGLTGTVVRLDLAVSAFAVTVKRMTQIASNYAHSCDPVTFVDAPTGLVYDPRKDVFYVASTLDNEVFAVADAGDTTDDRGRCELVYKDQVHLHGPLGMIEAPNGHLTVSNNDSAAVNSDPNQPSELVEVTKQGEFVKQISVDPVQGGSFGLAVRTAGTWRNSQP